LTIEQELQVERLQKEQYSRGVPLPPVLLQVLLWYWHCHASAAAPKVVTPWVVQ
jgi:hypothetical protein